MDAFILTEKFASPNVWLLEFPTNVVNDTDSSTTVTIGAAPCTNKEVTKPPDKWSVSLRSNGWLPPSSCSSSRRCSI